MRRSRMAETVFYFSEAIESFPGVRAVVTTRHGGTSPAPFDSLNLSVTVGDDPVNVTENLMRIHQALGLDPRATVDARQAQAGQVVAISQAERGMRIGQVDGLVTNSPGIPLLLRFADCVPVLFYDPANHAIGIAHAGWRGTVAKVVTNTVRTMVESFGSRPHDLVACIGPSIGPCCYEVGAEVCERVERAFAGADELLIRRNGSFHFDLWKANVRQLQELGVGHVEVAGICTADHTEDFYSWRREHALTGRFAAIIALQD